jgi:hypothetical protein
MRDILNTFNVGEKLKKKKKKIGEKSNKMQEAVDDD